MRPGLSRVPEYSNTADLLKNKKSSSRLCEELRFNLLFMRRRRRRRHRRRRYRRRRPGCRLAFAHPVWGM